MASADRAGGTRSRGWTWLAGLVVAAGSAVLTAHGLYEVAVASGVPGGWHGVAWLYPPVTDGLALVAYAATAQLARPGRAYAWAVVVLAAGLSALAQAAYLAGGLDRSVSVLRFGVGAWPAVAALLTAHLLYLVGRHRGGPGTPEPDHPATVTPSDLPARDPRRQLQPSSDDRCERPSDVQVERPRRAPVAPPSGVQSCTPEGVQLERSDGVQADLDAGLPARGGVPRTALPPRDRAFALAQLSRRQSGSLPSVRDLAAHAQVAMGTAATVLRELRDRPPATDDPEPRPPT